MNSTLSPKEIADREAARESIFLSAVVQFSSIEQSQPVRVRNISSGGMMIDCTAGAPIGEVVTVEIKNIGKVRGKVAWSVAPRMGISFDHDIDPSAARMRMEAPHEINEAYRSQSLSRRPGLGVR